MIENNTALFSSEMIREGYLWPLADYDRQLATLRHAIGQDLFLVLLKFSEINLAVILEGKPVTLLDVFDFPAPDPVRRLYPHMLMLSDGRDINLGHVARVTVTQAFDPGDDQVLYQQGRLLERLLFRERQLSEETIRRTSQAQLARLLGVSNHKRIVQVCLLTKYYPSPFSPSCTMLVHSTRRRRVFCAMFGRFTF